MSSRSRLRLAVLRSRAPSRARRVTSGEARSPSAASAEERNEWTRPMKRGSGTGSSWSVALEAADRYGRPLEQGGRGRRVDVEGAALGSQLVEHGLERAHVLPGLPLGGP